MKLSNFLAEQILNEESAIKTIVAIYPGRFQPMGKHHAKTYKWLQSQFKDAYVATSNKIALPKSPFSFNEKKKIINSHGISNVVQVKNPYKAEEILKKYDPKTTAAVFMVGKKDAGRLKGKFFQDWKGNADIGYRDGAYLIIAPHVSMSVPGYGEMSGTAIRKALGDTELDPKEKKKVFKGIFGHTKLYDMIIKKLESLTEVMEEFCQEFNITKFITESMSSGTGVDDGPRYFRSSMKGYKSDTKKQANRLGWSVVDYIVGGLEKLENHATDYPRRVHSTTGAPVGPVSFAPAGIAEPTDRLDRTDFRGTQSYTQWKRHIEKIVNTLGWKFVDWSGEDKKSIVTTTKNEPKKTQRTPDGKAGYGSAMKDQTKRSKVAKKLSEGLILEGGAYGHMSHPFDDRGLTFGDFKEIIKISLQGNLDLEQGATEKTDGQNLFITWNKGLKAARNGGDIKKGGVDSKAIASKFAGRGNIEKAFNYAMNDLSKAIGSISDKQKEKIFNGGNNWVNMEIMWPASSNVVSYDAPNLQFHNVLQYKNGSAVGAVNDGARVLAGMIKQVDANVQKNFSIIGPQFLKVNPHQDYSAKKPYFTAKLNTLMSKYNMSDSNTFSEYHQAYWEEFVNKKIGDVDNTIKIGLVKRWAFSDKSFRLNKKTIADEKILEKVINIDKQKHDGQVKKNMLPFEKLFFELGVEVLKNVDGYLAANPDKAVQNIRKQVRSAIAVVRKGGDIKKINRLSQQLSKLNSIGGMKAIVPSEGLVFVYKGKTYKLTGAFAPINQITGMIYF